MTSEGLISVVLIWFSGLDNVSTTYTLKLLRKLAHQGRTIVCTIHQPSASLFQLFDNVYVLSKGQCVYQGATTQLVSFLSSTGFHCPTHYNPADFGKNVENYTQISTDNYWIIFFNLSKNVYSHKNNVVFLCWNTLPLVFLSLKSSDFNTLKIEQSLPLKIYTREDLFINKKC